MRAGHGLLGFAALTARLSAHPLGGTLGQNASRLGDLGDGSGVVYNLGAQLVWSLLDFGRIRAQIAATDYVRALAEQIRAYVPRRYAVLGTDGFGRSDTRESCVTSSK